MQKFSRRTFLGMATAAAGGLALPRLAASVESPADRTLAARLAADPLRPQYHLLPKAHWMNDPNGPIWVGDRCHMFFQYNPNAAVWGDMHWAHATSPDLVHWRHQPVALSPTPGGYDAEGCFSGSAADDQGLPTVLYTGVSNAPRSQATLIDGQHMFREVQCRAVSHDGLRTWVKDAQPVIAAPPPGMHVTGFRDPCVWREGDGWMLLVGSGLADKGGMSLLYRSPDLRHWTYLHPLWQGQGTGKPAKNPVDNGTMWECPDFFPLGDRHVFLFSTEGKVLWASGRYRGLRFEPERQGRLDHGAFYAPKSMAGPTGERILWGWVQETRPEAEYSAAGWAGCMSLPRVLTLGPEGDLHFAPHSHVDRLRGTHAALPAGADAATARRALDAMRVRNLAADLLFTFVPDANRPFQLELRSEDGAPFTTLGYDRGRPGAELLVHDTRAPLAAKPGEPVEVRCLLDASVLEVFANGIACVTARVYKPAPSLRLSASDESLKQLRTLDLWHMHPISDDRLTT